MNEYNHEKAQEQFKKNKLLVEREVYACISSLAEYILKASVNDNNAPFTHDDVENLANDICEQCGQHEDAENHLERNKDAHEFINPNKEIFEWWIVSPWLCEKLSEKGEPVIRYENIWGRCTTGQAIAIDHVISEIQRETEYGNYGGDAK